MSEQQGGPKLRRKMWPADKDALIDALEGYMVRAEAVAVAAERVAAVQAAHEDAMVGLAKVRATVVGLMGGHPPVTYRGRVWRLKGGGVVSSPVVSLDGA